MSKIRNIRLIRLKYGITLEEFAKSMKISHQRLSQIELIDEHVSDATRKKLIDALYTMIKAKEELLSTFKIELESMQNSLWDWSREEDEA